MIHFIKRVTIETKQNTYLRFFFFFNSLRKSRPLHDLNFETQNCLDPLLHVERR